MQDGSGGDNKERKGDEKQAPRVILVGEGDMLNAKCQREFNELQWPRFAPSHAFPFRKFSSITTFSAERLPMVKSTDKSTFFLSILETLLVQVCIPSIWYCILRRKHGGPWLCKQDMDRSESDYVQQRFIIVVWGITKGVFFEGKA